MLNKNELILDRVRCLAAHTLTTSELLLRLRSLEDSSLTTTAEGDEIVDAIGALITTLYRSQKAKFASTATLISTDLLSAQYGTTKEIADTGKEIIVPTWEIKTIDPTTHKITLDQTPEATAMPKFAYMVVDGDVTTGGDNKLTFVESEPTDKQFTITGSDVTFANTVTGKVYIEYSYKSTDAMRIVKKANAYPEACSLVIDAIFRDKCNENLKYVGKIIVPKAKLNPEQIELALTSTGKHPFEFNIQSDYCDDEDSELFEIIIVR